MEVDILEDGALDLSDDMLARLLALARIGTDTIAAAQIEALEG